MIPPFPKITAFASIATLSFTCFFDIDHRKLYQWLSDSRAQREMAWKSDVYSNDWTLTTSRNPDNRVSHNGERVLL